MSYEERFAEASAYFKQAVARADATPAPKGQKFAPGSRVKITDQMPACMSHFPSGRCATVRYTYAHAFGGTDQRSLSRYCLDIDGIGEVSWYEEDQLSSLQAPPES